MTSESMTGGILWHLPGSPSPLDKDEEVRRTGITRAQRQAFDLTYIGGRPCESEQLAIVEPEV